MVSATTTDHLKVILQNLPLFAEEGGFSTTVPREQMVRQLTKTEMTEETAVVVVALVERLLLSLSLLDQDALERGEWRWISYPAQLAARSILSGSLVGGKVLESSFWYGDAPDAIVEQQRELLHRLEQQRIQSVSSPEPIRFVHVAWAIIRIGDTILLSHREDRTRSGQGNHVFIGGRMNRGDLQEQSGEQSLRILDALYSEATTNALIHTLQREVYEETGLHAREHYSATPLFSLDSYRELEGSGARHAYTEYDIHLFSLELTQAGFFRLFERVGGDHNLSLFTLDELVAGHSADGRVPYIKALVDQFQNRDLLHEQLSSFPLSWGEEYHQLGSEKVGVIVPVGSSGWRVGTAGHENRIEVGLTDEVSDLLLALACYSLGYALEPSSDADWQPTLLPYGWVEMEADQISVVAKAAGVMSEHGLDVIEVADQYARISIAPEQLFIDPRFFSGRIDESGIGKPQLVVESTEVNSAIGVIRKRAIKVEVADSVVAVLQRMEAESLYKDEIEATEKYLRRGADSVEKRSQLIGLRKLIRTSSNKSKLSIVFNS